MTTPIIFSSDPFYSILQVALNNSEKIGVGVVALAFVLLIGLIVRYMTKEQEGQSQERYSNQLITQQLLKSMNVQTNALTGQLEQGRKIADTLATLTRTILDDRKKFHSDHAEVMVKLGDITETVETMDIQSEKYIRALLLHLKRTIQNASYNPPAILMVDSDHYIQWANQSAIEVFELPEEQPIPCPLRLLPLEFADSTGSKGSLKDLEIYRTTRKGIPVQNEIMSARREGSDSPWKWFVVNTDISPPNLDDSSPDLHKMRTVFIFRNAGSQIISLSG